MKCLERESVVRHKSGTCETQEEPSQEAAHRAQSLHVPEPPNLSRVVPQQRIMWLPASKWTECLQFNEDVFNIIKATTKGDADS